MKKTLSAAFVVAALALTSACGGGGDRPTQAEMKKSITSKDGLLGTVPDKAADCVAGVIVKSDLSDKTLQAIIDKDEDYKPSKSETSKLTDLTPDITKCTAS